MYYEEEEEFRCPYCGKPISDDFFAMDSNKPNGDYGPKPFVVDIEEETENNKFFRQTLWTGKHLQLTVMSLKAGEEIGTEVHYHYDQFLKIEEGDGQLFLGNSKDDLKYKVPISDDTAIIIPAGTWHNVVNTGRFPLKLFSIYAPPVHPFNTVHKTKADAEAAEK